MCWPVHLFFFLQRQPGLIPEVALHSCSAAYTCAPSSSWKRSRRKAGSSFLWIWVQTVDLAKGLWASTVCLKAGNRMVTKKLGLQKSSVIWHCSSWSYAIIMHQRSGCTFWMKAKLYLLLPERWCDLCSALKAWVCLSTTRLLVVVIPQSVVGRSPNTGALQSALGTSEQLPGPWGLSALINVGWWLDWMRWDDLSGLFQP